MEPLVSIVIPVYNGANYLAEAIDSALAQTWPHVEVLVIDDGSTDDGATEAIARRYGDRIRYIRKPNGGVSSALNRGIAEMRGEYFSWLSHDDRYLPQKLERQVAYLREHPQTEVLGAGLEVIDAAGNAKPGYSSGDVIELRTGREVMDHWVYGCALLIRKSVFDRLGGFNESNRTVQDLEMWLTIVHAGIPIVMLPEVLAQWRHHGESDSFRHRASHLAEVDDFLLALPDRHPLAFFSTQAAPLSAAQIRDTWLWLARQGVHRGGLRSARTFYRRALGADPRPFTRTFWRIAREFLGSLRHV